MNPAALVLASREGGAEVRVTDLGGGTFRRGREVFNVALVSFRQKSIALDKDDVVQVKEAFKWVMQGLVAKELGGVAVVTKVGEASQRADRTRTTFYRC